MCCYTLATSTEHEAGSCSPVRTSEVGKAIEDLPVSMTAACKYMSAYHMADV